MEHTCNKCEACGKASFEQLMACDACQLEIDAKIEEMENGGKASDSARQTVPVSDELSGVRTALAPRTDQGRFTNQWPTHTGDERGGAS